MVYYAEELSLRAPLQVRLFEMCLIASYQTQRKMFTSTFEKRINSSQMTCEPGCSFDNSGCIFMDQKDDQQKHNLSLL